VRDRPTFRVHVLASLRRPGSVFFPNWLAITLGSHIWTWRPLDLPELAHELKHAEQWRRLGWRYPFRYWASSLRALRAGRNWYWDNEFEREAKAAADAAAALASTPETPPP
jgi:hypothetical protein